MAAEINFQKEIERIEEKLAENPKSRIFLQLAELYRKSESLEKAIEVLQNGLKTHPDYWTAKVALAKIFTQQNKVDDAIILLEDVTAKIPDNLLGNQLLGDIYYGRNDVSNTLKHYKKVLILNPDDEVRAKRVKKISGFPEDKIDSESKAKEVEPYTPEKVEEEKIDDIIPIQEGVQLEPSIDGIEIALPDIDFTKPVEEISESRGDRDEEEKVEEELISEIPPDAAKKKEEAEEISIEESTLTEPVEANTEESWDEIPTVTLAKLYYDQGYRDKALDILDQILDKEPDNDNALKFFDELTKSDKMESTLSIDDAETVTMEIPMDIVVEAEIAEEAETVEEIKKVEEIKGTEETIEEDETNEEGKIEEVVVKEETEAEEVTEEPVKVEEETSEKTITRVEDKRLKLLLNWLDGIK